MRLSVALRANYYSKPFICWCFHVGWGCSINYVRTHYVPRPNFMSEFALYQRIRMFAHEFPIWPGAGPLRMASAITRRASHA